MPYIKAERRDVLVFNDMSEWSAGDLAFMLTDMLVEYIKKKGLNYVTLAEVDGVLGLTQAEIRRRLTAPYEDRKLKENGDVGFDQILGGD